MNKLFSFIKVSLKQDMNIFKVSTNKQSRRTKILLPIILTLYIILMIGMYSKKLIDELAPMNLEYVALGLFAFSFCVLTLIEGIYKSGTLLFNCKDDNLLLSLPIKRSTVFFVRLFKFYIFEVIYNSLFLLAPIVIYAIKVTPGFTYYLTSIFALLLLPVIPVALSCIFGFIITFLSSSFKRKSIFQTIITTIFLLLVCYFAFTINKFVISISRHANKINDVINKIYYPINLYTSLVTDFSFKSLAIFILINIGVMLITIYVLGKLYFKVNSNYKRVYWSSNNSKFKIKKHSQSVAFIKKELNKFFMTPVYITNAGFGLVLYIIGCIVLSVKFNSIRNSILNTNLTYYIGIINNQVPSIIFLLVSFAALMTSITSSMISLEAKSLNILKSLPIQPVKIVIYKVVSALIIMLPCILIGDIILFIRFKLDFISIILILIASILLPFVSELIGIMINLKYPKLDSTNDTEIVKQSMSSFISVLIGMGLLGFNIISMAFIFNTSLNSHVIILIYLGFYGLIGLVLYLILKKNCVKSFNNINS